MEQEKKRKGCFRRGCLQPLGVVLGLYLLWTLWTGWLGPDSARTWGASIFGRMFEERLLASELREAEASGTAAYLELLRRPIPQSLERPAVGSDDPEVAAGRRLPREYDEALRERYYDDMDDLVGDYIVRNVFEHHYRWRYSAVSATLWDRRSPELIYWLAERADVLPPRRVDTLIFTNTYWVGEQDEAFWRATADAWRQMAQGKNPYWRLRALRHVQYWARDRDEERAVYLRALQEQSDAFLSTALRWIKYFKHNDPALMAAVAKVAREHPAGHDATCGEDIRRLAEETADEMRARTTEAATPTPVK